MRLNNEAVTGGCQVNIDAGTPITQSQAIGGATSLVLVFNRQGALTQRITYPSGGRPTVTTL